MTKHFLDNSNVIEFLCETANKFVEEKFGDDGYCVDEEGSGYTEEAQEYFDDTYDKIEGDLNDMLGVYRIEDDE
ncbi:hypothetical protein Ping_0143 [Psychromonas ingrahamii 37]|uniref:Uncharacterized protein n=1 Tax=Psychromonas ingrahamii (strain DSM 17664 / CCUG 51855 / 37) TaxID=357804 RepID=A1SR98_PSYIN|nr:hypothetical protein [Psychromonas ingrahamii]ABM02013.1 hypothetical protein Ping_0143 [Psychromonas ingrahamii 37]